MTTSTGCWWRSARFTAALRKVATESAADTMRTLSSPAEAAGKLRPTIRAMMATTTTISTRVTPRRVRVRASLGCTRRSLMPPLLILPTEDVGIDPFAAGLAIGAEAHDLRFVGLMFAGEAVDEVASPGVLWDVLGHVGAVPLVYIRGLHAQRLQALLGGGEGARIEFVGAQRGHEIIDLGARDGDFRLIRPLEQSRSDKGHEEPDDGHHHQHFDQGDTGLPGAFSIVRSEEDTS